MNMGIFSRLRDIVNSNINVMLEKAEDPEKLVKLMIQEMEDTLIEIKAHCAGAMAETRKVERLRERTLSEAERWEGRVSLAVRKGRDDLAKEALVQKRSLQRRAESLEREIAESAEIVARYKEDIERLEEKLADAREKRRTLTQRHRQASQSKQARETIRKADTDGAFARFEDFERRVDRMEADADLVNYSRKPDLDDEISRLAEDEEIEKELKELKEKKKQQ
jgi:phage shock protein A